MTWYYSRRILKGMLSCTNFQWEWRRRHGCGDS